MHSPWLHPKSSQTFLPTTSSTYGQLHSFALTGHAYRQHPYSCCSQLQRVGKVKLHFHLFSVSEILCNYHERSVYLIGKRHVLCLSTLCKLLFRMPQCENHPDSSALAGFYSAKPLGILCGLFLLSPQHWLMTPSALAMGNAGKEVVNVHYSFFVTKLHNRVRNNSMC